MIKKTLTIDVDEDDITDVEAEVIPEDRPQAKALARAEQASQPLEVRGNPRSRHSVDLLMMAKRALAVNPHAKARLELETEDEMEAALMLEHQGRGRVLQSQGIWIYEYEERSPTSDWAPPTKEK